MIGANPEPSELFERAFVSGGSIVVECGFCGRTHFSTVGSKIFDFDHGELEALKAAAEKDPDKFVAQSYTSIEYADVGVGKIAVIGCPCNALRRYEDWIWEHKGRITKYFRDRARVQLMAAALDARQATEDHVSVAFNGEKL